MNISSVSKTNKQTNKTKKEMKEERKEKGREETGKRKESNRIAVMMSA